jgi:AraC family transcriptional regulator
MAIRRTRTEFWGAGPARRETADFSFHLLAANAPEDEVQTHTHDEAHFVLVLSGGYMSSARNAPAISNTPLLVFNPPGTTHRDRFYGGRGTFLAISGGIDTHGYGYAMSVADPGAIQTARRIANAFHRQDLGQLLLDGSAQQLVAACSAPTSDESRRAHQPPAWLKIAFEMIYTSQDPQLSVAQVAAYVGVHPVHLARVFRHYLDCTPGDYLRGRRLERAAAAIGSTASLADAAYAAGFVDQAHLTRSFRSRYGITPAAWRKRQNVSPIQSE